LSHQAYDGGAKKQLLWMLQLLKALWKTKPTALPDCCRVMQGDCTVVVAVWWNAPSGYSTLQRPRNFLVE
jgi:hypothetical protein